MIDEDNKGMKRKCSPFITSIPIAGEEAVVVVAEKKLNIPNETIDRVGRSIGSIEVHVTAHHMLAMRDALESKDLRQPILFYVQRKEATMAYAWYPSPIEERLGVHLLQTLYATLVFEAHAANHRAEHRSLVEALIGYLMPSSLLQRDRECHREKLLLYFGTVELGTMRRVYEPHTDIPVETGGVAIYLLPFKMATYTWLGGVGGRIAKK